LRIREAMIVMERCHDDGNPTLKLEEVRIVGWRCHDGRHPTLILREITFPSWRFQESEDKVISYLTLVVRSLRVL